jgi:DHA2 family multidrug resistance protein
MANLIGYVTVVALFGAEFLMPVYLQALRGYSAFDTGLTYCHWGLQPALPPHWLDVFLTKSDHRVLIMLGFGILLINTWQLSQIQALTPIGNIMWLLALRGIALGMTVQTTFATALSSAPQPKIARASSLVNGTRFVVQSIGVAILATVLTSSLSADVKDQQNKAQETITTAKVARFGLCETPGVADADNIPAAAADKLEGLADDHGDSRQNQNPCPDPTSL